MFGSLRYVLPKFIVVQLGVVFCVDHDARLLPSVWPFTGRVDLDTTRSCADDVFVDLEPVVERGLWKGRRGKGTTRFLLLHC